MQDEVPLASYVCKDVRIKEERAHCVLVPIGGPSPGDGDEGGVRRKLRVGGRTHDGDEREGLLGTVRKGSQLRLVEEGPPIKRRVVNDASHDVLLNHRIRCLDKVRAPGAREKRLILRRLRDEWTAPVAVTGEMSKAHRFFQGRGGLHQLRGHFWSGERRLLVGATFWRDDSLDPPSYGETSLGDLAMIGGDRRGRRGIVLSYVILASLGLPFKWSKTKGGLNVQRIGYESSYATFKLEKQAIWLAAWTEELDRTRTVTWDDFACGLERLGFGANALSWERPSGDRLQAPMPIAPARDEATLSLFSDAKAGETQAWIGGYLWDGQSALQWYAMEVREDWAPWAFIKKDLKQIIASLELLGTLFCNKLWGARMKESGRVPGISLVEQISSQLPYASSWRDNMTLLDFLRKSGNNGQISQRYRRMHSTRKIGMPLEDWINVRPANGKTLVASVMYTHTNDRFYGQWLLWNVPFRNIDDLWDPEADELPQNLRYLGLCARSEMYMQNTLAMLAARIELIDAYLSGETMVDAEPAPALDGIAQVAGNAIQVAPEQAVIINTIGQRLQQALHMKWPEDAEVDVWSAWLEKESSAQSYSERPTAEKCTTMEIALDRAVQNGAHVGDELATAEIMKIYDLIVIDEIGQLAAWIFDRLLPLWDAADRRPAIIFVGDFCQPTGADGTTARDSPR
eukprot:s2526_g4.t1